MLKKNDEQQIEGELFLTCQRFLLRIYKELAINRKNENPS